MAADSEKRELFNRLVERYKVMIDDLRSVMAKGNTA